MTRKDYELIAAAIKRCADDSAPASVDIWVIHDVAVTLANSLKETNPLFDRTKFLKACGVE